MKNLQCFLTACLISMIMIVGYKVAIVTINDQMDIMHQDMVSLLLLQAVFVIKYVSGSVVTMPSSVNIKQVMAGYIVADLIFCVPSFWSKSLFPFSAEMLIAQAAILLVYAKMERRTSEKTESLHEWETANELVFQGI
jgi:hypothetical protein